MKPSECRRGQRVYTNLRTGVSRGVIVRVLIDDTQVSNRVRNILVRWDGAINEIEVDPADLCREIPAPVDDPQKLERWLSS